MKNIVQSLNVLIAAGVFAVASFGPSFAAEEKSPDNSQWMERMQTHWQEVIKETDPQKRQELMREHEQIMAEAAGDSGAHMGSRGDTGHMDMDSAHVDMMNTVDMHQHMIDMMR